MGMGRSLFSNDKVKQIHLYAGKEGNPYKQGKIPEEHRG